MNYKIVSLVGIVSSTSFAYGVNFGNLMLLGDSNTSQAIFESGYLALSGAMHNRLTTGGHTATMVGPNTHFAYQSGAGIELKHTGFSGWSVRNMVDGRTGQEDKGKLSDWVTTYNPDTVMFFGGGNDWADFRNGLYSTAAQKDAAKTAMRGRFTSVFDTIYGQNSDAAVFWGSYIQSSNSSFFSSGQSEFYQMIESLMYEMSTEQRLLGRDVYEVPLYSVLEPNPNSHLRDTVHLNRSGINRVADSFYGQMNAVPEPTSLLLLGGFVPFVMRRRKKAA